MHPTSTRQATSRSRIGNSSEGSSSSGEDNANTPSSSRAGVVSSTISTHRRSPHRHRGGGGGGGNGGNGFSYGGAPGPREKVAKFRELWGDDEVEAPNKYLLGFDYSKFRKWKLNPQALSVGGYGASSKRTVAKSWKRDYTKIWCEVEKWANSI